MMTMKISQVSREFGAIAPSSLAASWDNSGWQLRQDDNSVSGILLTIDVTEDVIDEAVQLQANLIVSHHPLLFEPLKSLDLLSAKSRILAKAIRDRVSIFSMHTNLDIAPHGTSFALGELLGLTKLRFLSPLKLRAPFDVGWGVIGSLEQSITAVELQELVTQKLETRTVRLITDNISKKGRAVAVGAGALSNLIPDVLEQNVQFYVTSDIKYHDAQLAHSNGLSLVDVDHYFAERPVLERVKRLLEPTLSIPVYVSGIITSPFHTLSTVM
jgi:dinuclear metal center YbgI/SA1388 family protein